MPSRPPVSQRVLATVLFTDIVRSTELAAEFGDRRWRRTVSAHHTLVRRQLRTFGGKEIDTAGDGFFATFDQPAQAIRCAQAIVDGVRRLGLEIRAGIHMGEVEVEGPSVRGLTVHIGARVMAQAGPGEIFVSSTVRDLLSGSEISFDDRGTRELKGVPTQWRLYAISGIPGAEAEEEPESDIEEAPGSRRPPVIALVAGVAGLVSVALVVWLLVGRADRGGLLTPRPNTVVRIDSDSAEVQGAIPVGTTPISIAAAGSDVWVANFDDQTLQRIDPSTNEASAARALPTASPTGLAVGGGYVWVTSSISGTLFKVDPALAHANVPIRLSGGVSGVAYGAGAVWVTNEHEGTLLRVDPRTEEVRTVKLDTESGPLGVTVGGGGVWVAESLAGKVVRVEPGSMKVTATISVLAGGPEQVAFGEGYVWASVPDEDAVVRIDPRSEQPTTINGVGNGPAGVAAGNGAAWVANGLDGTITRIDPRQARVVDTYRVGYSPEGAAVTPGAVWITLHTA